MAGAGTPGRQRIGFGISTRVPDEVYDALADMAKEDGDQDYGFMARAARRALKEWHAARNPAN